MENINNKSGLTVAICTHNRCNDLRITLSSLMTSSQSFCDSWELLVIDNNSTDQTIAVVKEFETLLPLRYIFEPQEGLSNARNRAIQEASLPFLVFTDDDVEIQPGWLAAYAQILCLHPELAFAGGKVIPSWMGIPPDWFLDFAQSYLKGVAVWYEEGDKGWYYSQEHEPFYGANVGFQISALLTLGGFDPRFGMTGSQLGVGEETIAIERLSKKGFLGAYIPSAIVRHRIYPIRWTRRFIFRYAVADGKRVAKVIQFPNSTQLFRQTTILFLKIAMNSFAYLTFSILRESRNWVPAFWNFGRSLGTLLELGLIIISSRNLK